MARFRRFDTGISPALDDVRARRAGLKAALSRLEIALAGPAPHRVAEWTSGVRDALGAVHEVWTRHVVETEAPGGFLDEIVSESPRLSSPVSKLRREHNEILGAIVEGEERLANPPIDVDIPDLWVDDVRNELTRLLVALARHRQRGADLVYEAYDVDIGGDS